jgi:GNAT superfamily N-acetyltransferase
MRIREALPSDAKAMSTVLIASITELCAEDHGGRPEALAEWTANKTPESIRLWFDNPANRLFVADQDGEIVGVGGFNTDAEIILNYVSPAARFRGVSKAMLHVLEREMLALGFSEAHLDSTTTARRFYEQAGWRAGAGESSKFCNTRCRTMTKRLA